MKFGLIIVAAITVAVSDVGFAAAGNKPHAPVYQRVREPCSWSWTEIFWPSCSVGLHPTGAAPAAYVGHSYAGQDPDARIRGQLQREFGRDRP